MSICKDFGKDKVIFVTKEDHEKPCSITLPSDDEPRGLIMPDGSINWNCPCIGGTASGPCGYQFREAFTCFHYSTSETKGSECIDKFSALNECMAEFPTLYTSKNKQDEELQEELDKMDSFDRDKLDQELKSLDEKLGAKKDNTDKK
jgi:intermembrane space import and assembly protein 40